MTKDQLNQNWGVCGLVDECLSPGARVGAVGRLQLSVELGLYVAFAKTAKFDIGIFYKVVFESATYV